MKNILLILIWVIPVVAQAVTLSFAPQVDDVHAGNYVTVSLYADTEDKVINAIEGVVRVSENLEIIKVSTGGSVVDFWITEPVASKDNTVSFAGVIPGGFSGVHVPLGTADVAGSIMTITVRTKETGEGAISIDALRALLHDGAGTQTNVSVLPYVFRISQSGQGGVEEVLITDTEPPQAFTIIRAQDENIFDGKYFISFATKDSGSGVEYYEVAEGTSRHTRPEKLSWKKVQSPYVLEDQSGRSVVFVKAVDYSGNEIISTLSPQKVTFGSQKNITKGILISIGVLFIYALFRQYRSNKKKIRTRR